MLIVAFLSYQNMYVFYSSFIENKEISINYSVGLEWMSIFIDIDYSYVIYLLIFLYLLTLFFYIKKAIEDKETKKEIIKGILISPLAVIAISIFPVLIVLIITVLLLPIIYVIINTYHQEFSNISFWKEEMANGFFAIRILSISLFIYTIFFFKKSSSLRKQSVKNNIRYIYKNKKEKLTEKQLSYMWVQQGILSIGYYNMIIIFIILSKYLQKESLFIVVASWGLLFIVDDWKIISDYTVEYSKETLFWHKIKLHIFDFLLIFTVNLAVFNIFNIKYAVLVSFFTILFFFFKIMNHNLTEKFSKHRSLITVIPLNSSSKCNTQS